MGICIWCGNPVDDGEELCEQCEWHAAIGGVLAEDACPECGGSGIVMDPPSQEVHECPVCGDRGEV